MNHQGEAKVKEIMKRKKENITHCGLLQKHHRSGRLMKVPPYLSSHGDKIGNAGQTRWSPPTKIHRSKR